MSLYLMSVYGSCEIESQLREDFAKAGKKLDMGKSCIRFKSLEDLPLPVLGKVISRVTAKQYVAGYEVAFPRGTVRRPHLSRQNP